MTCLTYLSISPCALVHCCSTCQEEMGITGEAWLKYSSLSTIMLGLQDQSFSMVLSVSWKIQILTLEWWQDTYTYAILLAISSFTGALCSFHFNLFMTELGVKVRAALTTAVYDNTVTVSKSSLSQFSCLQILTESTNWDQVYMLPWVCLSSSSLLWHIL